MPRFCLRIQVKFIYKFKLGNNSGFTTQKCNSQYLYAQQYYLLYIHVPSFLLNCINPRISSVWGLFCSVHFLLERGTYPLMPMAMLLSLQPTSVQQHILPSFLVLVVFHSQTFWHLISQLRFLNPFIKIMAYIFNSFQVDPVASVALVLCGAMV